MEQHRTTSTLSTLVSNMPLSVRLVLRVGLVSIAGIPTLTRSAQRGWGQALIRLPAGSRLPRQSSLAGRPANNKKPAPSLAKPTGRDNSDYRLRAWGEGWAVGGDPSPSGGASRWGERLL